MRLYDLRPGDLIETDDDVVLSTEDVEKGRELLEKGEPLEKVAKKLGGRVPDPPDPPQRVAIDADRLNELLALPERVAELERQLKEQA